MRGIIRYLSRCKRFKVRSLFSALYDALRFFAVVRVFCPFYFYFYFLFFIFSPPPFLSPCAGWVRPPTQAFLTPNLCSCKSALRKKRLEEHSLLEAVQDPLSLSAGAPQSSHRHYFIPLKLSHL